MTDIHYRDAVPDDAPALAKLFAQSFTESFGPLYKEEDLAAFLAGKDEPVWQAELQDPSLAFRIVEADGVPVAFAKVGGISLPIEPDGPSAELRQIYILKPWQGKGIAEELMSWVFERARSFGARELYLTVFVDNPRARRFYDRYGFEFVKPYAFMVGDHADEDHILRLRLDA